MTIYSPAEVAVPCDVWDVLEGKAIQRVLWVDTEAGIIATSALDESGRERICGDNLVIQPIKYQAIYPWPLTGKPRLFNCYYRKTP